ncbi:hypothetical protein DEM27_00060 [Metarhizobium album]|uniref:Uncharacterized protein n=1 Tax=Metarhizobium album TaxID=2182425 RepID=A0A2U2DWE2_9HYPH|nr:hypothetical protein [Rhizobium album]PWE57645.1 hypothetical protein DEM27_00060 [Rhizobium album]
MAISNSADIRSSGPPVGPRALAFLARVRLASGALRAGRNAEREAGIACCNARLLTQDCRDDDLFRITPDGIRYLDRLLRCE